MVSPGYKKIFTDKYTTKWMTVVVLVSVSMCLYMSVRAHDARFSLVLQSTSTVTLQDFHSYEVQDSFLCGNILKVPIPCPISSTISLSSFWHHLWFLLIDRSQNNVERKMDVEPCHVCLVYILTIFSESRNLSSFFVFCLCSF